MGADTKTVDVLAVLDRIQQEADQHPFNPVGHVVEHGIGADRIRETRAAIAELIEAAREATEEKLHDGASSRAACDRLIAALRGCESPSSYPTPSESVGNAASVEGGA